MLARLTFMYGLLSITLCVNWYYYVHFIDKKLGEDKQLIWCPSLSCFRTI